MAYKLYAYWSAPKPEDVEAFEEYYANTHVPRAAAVPNLKAIVTTRTADGFEGGATDHYRVAEMVFASAEALAESAESEEWATMRACSGDIIERFGVELRVEMGEVD
ncbi:MAG: EthD family reductase [Actinobacteria bacterium]|nr:EthD family reductase [Actinomycetota bacterium]